MSLRASAHSELLLEQKRIFDVYTRSGHLVRWRSNKGLLMPLNFHRGITIASAIAALCSIAVTARAADPNALWNIVHGQCVPGERGHGDRSPCANVDLSAGEAAGFAVLKDIKARRSSC